MPSTTAAQKPTTSEPKSVAQHLQLIFGLSTQSIQIGDATLAERARAAGHADARIQWDQLEPVRPTVAYL